GRHVLGELTLDQVRDAAGEFDDLEAALHLAARVRQHLAVLAHDAPGELLDVLGDELAELEQDRRALPQRGPAPRDRRFLGDGDGAIDVGNRGEANPPGRRAGGRVVYRTPTLGVALEWFAANPVGYGGGRSVRRLSGGRHSGGGSGHQSLAVRNAVKLKLEAQSGQDGAAGDDRDVVGLAALIVEEVVASQFERQITAQIARQRGAQAEPAIVFAPVLAQAWAAQILHRATVVQPVVGQLELVVVDPVEGTRAAERGRPMRRLPPEVEAGCGGGDLQHAVALTKVTGVRRRQLADTAVDKRECGRRREA